MQSLLIFLSGGLPPLFFSSFFLFLPDKRLWFWRAPRYATFLKWRPGNRSWVVLAGFALCAGYPDVLLIIDIPLSKNNQ